MDNCPGAPRITPLRLLTNPASEQLLNDQMSNLIISDDYPSYFDRRLIIECTNQGCRHFIMARDTQNFSLPYNRVQYDGFFIHPVCSNCQGFMTPIFEQRQINIQAINVQNNMNRHIQLSNLPRRQNNTQNSTQNITNGLPRFFPF